MASGEDVHIMTLRKPLAIDPIVLDLDKGLAKGSFRMDGLPKETHLKLVLSLAGGIPKSLFQPSSDLTADLNKTKIVVGQDLATQALAIEVTGTFKRNIGINTRAVYSFDPKQKPQPFLYAKVKNLAGQAQQQSVAASNSIKQQQATASSKQNPGNLESGKLGVSVQI